MTRSSVAHDHLELERGLKSIKVLIKNVSTDGRVVIELGDELGAFEQILRAHHQNEEATLFPLAAQADGGWGEDLNRLVEQHRLLERLLGEISDLIHNESDLKEAGDRLHAFGQAFDAHTLAEADYLTTRWDELFPGEIMAG